MSAEIRAKVREAFVRIAVQTGDDVDELRMFAPGLAGVQYFLESIVGDVSEADVRRWYESQGLLEQQSLAWSNVEFMLTCWNDEQKQNVDKKGEETSEGEGENEAREIALLIDKIRERQEGKEFPIVRPSDLQDPEQQEAASMSLGLLEKIETVKIESYIAEMRHKAMECEAMKEAQWSEQCSEPETLVMKELKWTYANYYWVVRDYLIQESMENKRFAHRCFAEQFLSLIPPQTISVQSEKEKAFATAKKVKPEYLLEIDKALWNGWREIECLLDITGEDPKAAFKKYIEKNYYSIIDKVCVNAKGLRKESFLPPYAPDAFATAEEEVERLQLLTKASVSESNEAEVKMKQAYTNFRNSKSELQQAHLPTEPPSKFATQQFYSSLAIIVAEMNLREKPSTERGEASQGSSSSSTLAVSPLRVVAASHPQVHSMNSLEALVAGTVPNNVNVVPVDVTYLSSRECMESTGEISKCKFQGVLAACVDQSRIVEFSEGSPRKRKTNATSTKAADFILVDLEGTIPLTVWDELADRICEIWREVAEARERGENSRKIIDLSIMRLQTVLKSKWNGEILTPFRILGSIEAVGTQRGTELNVLSSATAPNLMNASFIEPSPRFCVGNFQSIRGKLRAPFRITVKGMVMDLCEVEYTQSQNTKRVFDLMDPTGAYVKVSAMVHNSMSSALQNRQEVICYFGTGRGPIGSSPGMIYLMKDAMILPIGGSFRLPPAAKGEYIEVLGQASSGA